MGIFSRLFKKQGTNTQDTSNKERPPTSRIAELCRKLGFQESKVSSVFKSGEPHHPTKESPTATQDEDEEVLLQKGLQFAQLDDYDNAIVSFDKVISLNPRHTAALVYKGVSLMYLRHFDESLKYFDKVIEIDPHSTLAWQQKAQILALMNRTSEADQCNLKAVSATPNDALGYLGRGIAHYSRTAYDKAIADFSRAVELNPKLADAFNMRGTAYRQKGDYEQAIKDLDMAIALNPKFVDAYTNRGNSYRKKGNLDQAIRDHTRAITLNPKSGIIYFNRGRAYFEKGDYKAARLDWEKTAKLEPPDSNVRVAALNNLELLKGGQENQVNIDSGVLLERIGTVPGEESSSSEENSVVKYMEMSVPEEDGFCSDDACPCGPLGVRIPRGEGFIYISKQVVDFRSDCLSNAEVAQKLERLLGGVIGIVTASVWSPILVCELGAKKRKLDLKVAAEDAQYWWKTGLVPLRPTPILSSQEES